MKTTLYVDPGYHTGWALFSDEDQIIPIKTGIINCPVKIKGTIERIKYMQECFYDLIVAEAPNDLIIEGVVLHTGSAKSTMAAGKGDLFNLAYLVGAYVCNAFLEHINVKIVTVNEWKGSLSKQAVHARIKKVTGQKYPEHIADAVGIGLAEINQL